MRKLGQQILLGIACAALLSGCTYESGIKEFDNVLNPDKSQQSVAQTESGIAWFKAALKNAETNPKAQKFWYNGYIKNRMLSRQTNGMFDGVVVKPEGYLMNASIATQKYQYLARGDKRYIRPDKSDNWLEAKENPLPINIMQGYEDWLPFLDHAVQLPDDKVLGTECVPFQIKISGEEWLTKSNSDLFATFKQELASRPDLQQLLKKSTVKMTFWIGKDKEDRLLHQYQTWIILPVPGGGYMDQEVIYRFFKYDDSVKLTAQSEVEKYLLK